MEFDNWNLKRWVLSHFILLTILALCMWQFFQISNNNLSIAVLDVGQGDSILIQTSDYKNILIDAGENSLVIDELGDKINFFNQAIDLAIVTHPHRDHFGGFLDILQKYPIKQIMLTGVVSSDPIYQALLNEINEQNIPIIFPRNDQDLQIATNEYLDIIYPLANQSLIGQSVKNKNNTSIVLKVLKYNNESIALLTGDAEHEEEREMLLTGQDISSPILKLGHHGSRTATSDEFLNAVKPKTAIVSAGLDNQFNHPHEETMEKLSNIEVFETVNGTILLNY